MLFFDAGIEFAYLFENTNMFPMTNALKERGSCRYASSPFNPPEADKSLIPDLLGRLLTFQQIPRCLQWGSSFLTRWGFYTTTTQVR